MPPLMHFSEPPSVNERAATPLSLVDDIDLPAVRKFAPSNPSCYYGSLAVAAAYCGLDSVPENIRGFWQHGWAPRSWQLDPMIVTGLDEDMRHKNSGQYWVTRQDEVGYLRSSGYKHVTAIGLPIVYLPHEETKRRPGSLLVMPVHSLDYTTPDWKFAEYADEIVRIKDRFSEVVICVHPSCWKRGYWVEAFKQRGFEVVQGALVEDLNALRRIQELLLTFEYVTTNYFGSPVVYAAYFGAKVSVFGPYAEFKEEDFASTPFYVEHPHVLEHTLRITSEVEMRRHYPEVFCHPLEAEQRIEWGRHEVGYDNKVSPWKMRSLFRWRLYDRAGPRIWASLPWRVRHLGKLAFQPKYRRDYIKTRSANRTHS